MTVYCDVIVDILTSKTDKTFTYLAPESMRLEQGDRVLVPFGPRKLEGIVLRLKDSTDLDLEKIKSVLKKLDPQPAILSPLMDLAKEMAQDEQCPLAATLRLMIPAQMRMDRVKPKTQTVVRWLGGDLEEAKEKQGRSQKRKLLLDLLSNGQVQTVEQLKLLVRDPLPSLKHLSEQGLVDLSEQEVFRSPFQKAAQLLPDPILTPDQEVALSEILPAVEQGKGSFLLYGVTGSGKTEVYIRAVRRCLHLGKTAIVLVPEIVLTPQIVSWFRSRFGNVAAVLHSRLSSGEKYDEWRRIRRGDARVVIGARSAVFAPVSDLGVIIIDEEHEQSYLSEHAPSYDARKVARSRCQREGATLLLASATPSLVSYAKARKGSFMLLEMPRRVNNLPLPEVELVDMREELRLGNRSIFSAQLQFKLKECVQKGEQTILFVNRRGYAPSVQCLNCGQNIQCPSCEVAMTFHREDQRLHCHYCGNVSAMPKVCPECASPYIKPMGVGTQRVEEEVKKLLPGVDVVRLDADTTQGKHGHQRQLDRFRQGKAKVMVGTQMVAKGLDFPAVTLVGAVLADLTLNLPDFRSAERTFQLLTQAAGRAGRAQKQGLVIVQTYKPEHYAVKSAALQDYLEFFKVEFEKRKRGLYPPFTKLVRLLVRDESLEKAREKSGKLLQEIRQALKDNPHFKKEVIFVREDEAPIRRLMGRYRAQVFMKVLEQKEASPFMAYLTQLQERSEGDVTLQVNPPSLA
jgi:primosomal protein N' (replication factor Y)